MYYIFAGLSYYPRGGINDLRGEYEREMEAMQAICGLGDIDWWQLIHVENNRMTIINSGTRT